jgi:hypothetical protein
MKCGYAMSGSGSRPPQQQPAATVPPKNIVGAQGASSFKCPNCGAPIAPRFGEMVITCEYCGSGVTLGDQGWTSISKQSMLPINYSSKDAMLAKIHEMMDRGLLHRHLQESSNLEEMNMTIVPYWVISVSARTSIVATDTTAPVGTIATEAALIGVLGGMGGGRRGGFGGARIGEGMVLGSMMGGMGGMGGGGMKKTYELDFNYNFPVVALKALTDYQPRDYAFSLDQRTLFDVTKLKGFKILNGDVSEDAAKYQAKTLVDQLQAKKAHDQYHMIQQLHTEEDVADSELLYVPVWFARYDHKGNKIIMVLDGNSGSPINSIGLS